MAHFAEIVDGKVARVIVVNNAILGDPEDAEKGIEFCKARLGGEWVQTSYNGRIRKNYAGVGYTYDPDLDAFIPPCKFKSWVLDAKTCRWVAPVPMPDGTVADWRWDEGEGTWISAK